MGVRKSKITSNLSSTIKHPIDTCNSLIADCYVSTRLFTLNACLLCSRNVRSCIVFASTFAISLPGMCSEFKLLTNFFFINLEYIEMPLIFKRKTLQVCLLLFHA